MSFKLLGVGSPLVDYSLTVSDEFLEHHVPGGKGCTRNITDSEKEAILRAARKVFCRTPGGSAANTIRIFAALGGHAALFGKSGDDDDGEFFRDALKKCGADTAAVIPDGNFSTGYCLSLITPDAERTMLSNLGASVQVEIGDLEYIDIRSFDFILMEGYLSGEKWFDRLIGDARRNGCRIALDLNNYELVAKYRDRFLKTLDSGIDLLFANSQEISQLFPDKKTTEIIALLQKRIPVTVLKLGRDGALIITGKEVISIDAEKNIEVKDTTGAGDFFAAGFLYGLSKNAPMEICGRAGTLCAAAIISELGTSLTEEKANKLKNIIQKEVTQ